MERATLTVEEAAEVIGLSRSLAYKAVRSGQIPSIRFGKRLLVPRIALQRMIEGAGKPEKVSGAAALGYRLVKRRK